jgi:hypothetical protein
MVLNKIGILILLLFMAISCKKHKPKPIVEELLTNGIMVLNEGLFQQNNSSLTWIDITQSTNDNSFFETKIGRGMGDTGNDLKRYGGKIYIVVNVSSTIEVLDASTGKLIKQVVMQTAAGVAKQPRSITFSGGNAFVSCYDGFVDVFDTTNIQLVTRIAVGKNPDQICSSGSNVYVSNSGGLDFPLLDSTVSVINATSFNETAKIVVGKNPGVLAADGLGFVYVAVRGNYGSVLPKFLKINTSNNSIAFTANWNISSICPVESKLLLIAEVGATQAIWKYDLVSSTIENSNFLSGVSITKPYNLQANPVTGLIYVSDAKNYTTTGELFEFSAGGSFLKKWNTGINPSKMLFY